MRITHCRTCNKELVNRRSHIQTCSSSCRSRLWRASKVPMILVKLMFTNTEYALIKTNAGIRGFSLDEYLHKRVVTTAECRP